MYNIAIRMLAHPQDAEDATQEILIKAIPRRSSFEERSSFRTWLYRIVVNHVLSMTTPLVDPANLLFARARVTQVREVVPETFEALGALDAQCGRIFREQPYYEAPDLVPALRPLIDTDELRRATELPWRRRLHSSPSSAR